MAKIKDESNPDDDAKLPKRDRAAGRAAIDRQRGKENRGPNDIHIPGRPGHPDGWQEGGR